MVGDVYPRFRTWDLEQVFKGGGMWGFPMDTIDLRELSVPHKSLAPDTFVTIVSCRRQF